MDTRNSKSKGETSRTAAKNSQESATNQNPRSLRSGTRKAQERQTSTQEEKVKTTSIAAVDSDISESNPSDECKVAAPQHKKTNFSSDAAKIPLNIDQANDETQLATGDVQISKEAELVNTVERAVPAYNVPEKIVIAIDISQDEIYSNFKLSNGVSCKPLAMLKRAIHLFLYNKQALDTAHQYALVLLNENTASWILDFTSNVKAFLAELDKIEECTTEDIFNLNSLFNVINENVSIPHESKEESVPPPYVVRVILFYGRSYTLPKIDRSEASMLLDSAYFTLDILMTHEPVNTNNYCAEILKILENLDTKGFGYFFTVARNPLLLLTSTAKLLSHPLQRPIQSQAKYINCV